MTKIGIMICGHGSRDEGAIREFSQVATGLEERITDYPVESGFLEFATPIIKTGLNSLKEQGVNHILAVPAMLFAAGHAKNDIPSVLNTWEAQNPEVRVEYGRELGIDPKMIAAAGECIKEALASNPSDIPLEESVLVVVGRGASDPDANSNISKIMRMLWEGFGFGWGEVCYSGVTFPLVKPGLEHVARLGYKRVIVFPYFLFTGVLIQRIYDGVDAIAANYPDIDFVKASYLNNQPLVIDTFIDRINEILEGTNLMNCKMCKYRTQVLGFENEVGLPQESHHHHVEGINANAKHDDEHHHHIHGDHIHGDHIHGDHTHDHHHHPYPHADHPLGPRTLKDD